MTVSDSLKASNVWDARYLLPLVPMHSNPHIYAAYAVRVMEAVDEPEGPEMASREAMRIRDRYEASFLTGCEIELGLLTTWPARGVSRVDAGSHDDLYGACFMDARFCRRAIDFVTKNDGVYSVDPKNETKNLYRFLFVRSAMQAWAQYNVGAFSQALFILALLFHLVFTKDGDTSGHLLLWLAFPAMRKNKAASAFIDYWSETWTRRGYTPQSIFKKHYLTECPWFGTYARDDWK